MVELSGSPQADWAHHQISLGPQEQYISLRLYSVCSASFGQSGVHNVHTAISLDLGLIFQVWIKN